MYEYDDCDVRITRHEYVQQYEPARSGPVSSLARYEYELGRPKNGYSFV